MKYCKAGHQFHAPPCQALTQPMELSCYLPTTLIFYKIQIIGILLLVVLWNQGNTVDICIHSLFTSCIKG